MIYTQIIQRRIAVAMCVQLLRLEVWHKLMKWAHDREPHDIDALYRRAFDRLSDQSRLPLTFPIARSLEAKRAFLVRTGDELREQAFWSVDMANRRLTNELLDAALEEVVEWGIGSYDAVVVAVARAAALGVGLDPNVVTMDRDFARVGGINVWGLRD